MLDITQCTFSCGRFLYYSVRTGTYPGFEGCHQAGCAHLRASWSHMASIRFISPIGLARDSFARCCSPKTDVELGPEEDVRCRLLWRCLFTELHNNGLENVTYRSAFKLPLRMTISVRSSSVMPPPPIPWHSLRVPVSLLWHRHGRTGPTSCRGAGGGRPEVSSPNILSIACPSGFARIRLTFGLKIAILGGGGLHRRREWGGGGGQGGRPPPPPQKKKKKKKKKRRRGRKKKIQYLS